MLSRENMFVTNIIKITEDTEKLRTKTFIAQKLITHKNINRRTSYKIYISTTDYYTISSTYITENHAKFLSIKIGPTIYLYQI